MTSSGKISDSKFDIFDGEHWKSPSLNNFSSYSVLFRGLRFFRTFIVRWNDHTADEVGKTTKLCTRTCAFIEECGRLINFIV